MTTYKEAVDAWIETGSYKRSADPTTLRAPRDYRIYLENRLREAFASGWNAHEQFIAREAARTGLETRGGLHDGYCSKLNGGPCNCSAANRGVNDGR